MDKMEWIQMRIQQGETFEKVAIGEVKVFWEEIVKIMSYKLSVQRRFLRGDDRLGRLKKEKTPQGLVVYKEVTVEEDHINIKMVQARVKLLEELIKMPESFIRGAKRAKEQLEEMKKEQEKEKGVE